MRLRDLKVSLLSAIPSESFLTISSVSTLKQERKADIEKRNASDNERQPAVASSARRLLRCARFAHTFSLSWLSLVEVKNIVSFGRLEELREEVP